MREGELQTKFKKLNIERVRDRLASLRNDVLRCQRMTDSGECEIMIRELGKELRDLSDIILKVTGEEEEET